MMARNLFRLAVTVFSAMLLTAVPVASEAAEMLCSACHDIHNAAGGTLNTAAEFVRICDSCQCHAEFQGVSI